MSNQRQVRVARPVTKGQLEAVISADVVERVVVDSHLLGFANMEEMLQVARGYMSLGDGVRGVAQFNVSYLTHIVSELTKSKSLEHWKLRKNHGVYDLIPIGGIDDYDCDLCWSSPLFRGDCRACSSPEHLQVFRSEVQVDVPVLLDDQMAEGLSRYGLSSIFTSLDGTQSLWSIVEVRLPFFSVLGRRNQYVVDKSSLDLVNARRALRDLIMSYGGDDMQWYTFSSLVDELGLEQGGIVWYTLCARSQFYDIHSSDIFRSLVSTTPDRNRRIVDPAFFKSVELLSDDSVGFVTADYRSVMQKHVLTAQNLRVANSSLTNDELRRFRSFTSLTGLSGLSVATTLADVSVLEESEVVFVPSQLIADTSDSTVTVEIEEPLSVVTPDYQIIACGGVDDVMLDVNKDGDALIDGLFVGSPDQIDAPLPWRDVQGLPTVDLNLNEFGVWHDSLWGDMLSLMPVDLMNVIVTKTSEFLQVGLAVDVFIHLPGSGLHTLIQRPVLYLQARPLYTVDGGVLPVVRRVRIPILQPELVFKNLRDWHTNIKQSCIATYIHPAMSAAAKVKVLSLYTLLRSHQMAIDLHVEEMDIKIADSYIANGERDKALWHMQMVFYQKSYLQRRYVVVDDFNNASFIRARLRALMNGYSYRLRVPIDLKYYGSAHWFLSADQFEGLSHVEACCVEGWTARDAEQLVTFARMLVDCEAVETVFGRNSVEDFMHLYNVSSVVLTGYKSYGVRVDIDDFQSDDIEAGDWCFCRVCDIDGCDSAFTTEAETSAHIQGQHIGHVNGLSDGLEEVRCGQITLALCVRGGFKLAKDVR